MACVTIRRDGNLLEIGPPHPRIRAVLLPYLTFTELVRLYGPDARRARDENRPTIYEEVLECYALDYQQRICTTLGFLNGIRKLCRREGWDTRLIDLTKLPRPDAYQPDWSRIADVEFRHRQEETLRMFAQYWCGRIDCFPGYGKSWLIGHLANVFYRAKIAVATKRVPVACQRIYPELCQMLPSVGIQGGGVSRKGRRVMVYTFDSLHHADGDEDFLIVDEGHEAAADKISGALGKFAHARRWGLSASWDLRLDGKDKRCEALFGPVRISIPYSEGVTHNMVVPIEVIWEDVLSDVDPCEGVNDPIQRKKLAYWRNDFRNAKIRSIARRYDRDVQVLIPVETVEHALALKLLLPEYTLVHGEIEPKKQRYFVRQDLWPDDFRECTLDRRERLAKAFERGSLKKVIVTTVWNVGVSFNDLQVLIRADGGSSPINSIQLPGRTSRLGSAASGKDCGIVHDLRDQFNSGCQQRARGREKTYREMGWKQHFPGRGRRELAQRLKWRKA